MDRQVHVAVVEEGRAVSVGGANVCNAVGGAAEVLAGPHMYHITYVRDKCILLRRDRDPDFTRRVEHL